MALDPVERAVEALARGEIVLVVDEEQRENEGDAVFAAELADEEKMAFLIKKAGGLVCVAVDEETAQRLHLAPMTSTRDHQGTAFTVSVDAAHGVSTGVSAGDRALTARLLADPRSRPHDFVRPGHLFPLTAKKGGVLRRAGHTEAGVDLMRLAGLRPAAVLCEVINEDGSMARLPDLKRFAQKHGLCIVSIADLIAYRLARETLVEKVAETKLPTPAGVFRAIGFRDTVRGGESVALVKGVVRADEPVLVRVHSGCVTGDVFGSLRCDCGQQLQAALRAIQREDRGVLVYIPEHEGRGIGLANKLKAYALQDQGMDTAQANAHLGFGMDLRDYGLGAQILRALGAGKLRLLTNNPRKIVGLKAYGLEIVERVPLQVPPNPHNAGYLRAKKEKMGHWLE